MSGIMTSVGINDGMSNVLKSILGSVKSLTTGFEHMQSCAATPIPTNIANSIKRDILMAQQEVTNYERTLQHISGLNLNVSNNTSLNSATQGLQHLTNMATQAEHQIQNTSLALNNMSNWNRLQGINIFNTTGTERIQKEMNDYRNMVNGISNIQDKLKNNIGLMDKSLLPQNAISDITHAENRVNSLIQSMQKLSNADMAKLNTSQVESMNNSFESMRQNASSMINVMSNLNTSISSGNVNGLNSGFNQLNNLVEQAERQIRNTGQALNELNSANSAANGMAHLQQTFENYKRSMENINRMKESFSTSSFHELIPKDSLANATIAEGLLNSLSSTMQKMSGRGMELLNPSQVESMQNSFENLRRSAETIQTTMSGIRTNINAGNLETVNAGFFQLGNLAAQATRDIRTTNQALNAMTSPHWQSITGGQELFTSTGILRTTQEMNSLYQMFQKLRQSQDQISQNSAKMSILPPNASQDFNLLNSRILNITNTIRMLEMQKSRLSRFDISGINNFNNRIESLRGQLNSALTAQQNINRAIDSNNLERMNQSARELHNILNDVGRQIRDNNDQQRQFSNNLSQTKSIGNSLMSVGNMFGMALANNIVNSAKQVIDSSIDKIIQVTEDSFKNGLTLIKSERELQARLGNDIAGTGLYKILAQDAKTSAFNESQMMKAASSYLPYTQNIKQIQDLNRITEILSLFDKTGQGAQGAMFAMRELIGGNTRSLATRFDISPQIIRSFNLDKLGMQDMDKFIDKTYEMLEALNMSGAAYEKMLEAPSTQLEMFSTNLETAFAKASRSGIENLTPVIKQLNQCLDGERASRFFGILEGSFTNLSDLGVRSFNLINQHSDALLDSMDSIATTTNFIGDAFMSATEWIVNNYDTVQGIARTFNDYTLGNPLTHLLELPNVYDSMKNTQKMLIDLKKEIELTKLSFNHLGDFVANTLDTMSMNFLVLKTNALNQFDAIKIGGIRIFQELLNAIIDGLNHIGQFSNTILGTKFDRIPDTTIGNSTIYNTTIDAIGRNMQDMLSYQQKQNAIIRRNQKWAKEEQRIIDTAEREKIMAVNNIENYRNRFKNKDDNAFNYNEINNLFKDIKGASPLGIGNDEIKNVGNVGNVDKINTPVDMINEDLRYLKELADQTAINKFTLETKAPEINITFGDVKETADVDKIIDEIKSRVEEDVLNSCEGVYIT